MQPAARNGRLPGLIVVVALAVMATTAFADTSASASNGSSGKSTNGAPPGQAGAEPHGNSGGNSGNGFGRLPGGPQSLSKPGADGVPGRGVANGHRDDPPPPPAPTPGVVGEASAPETPAPPEGNRPPTPPPTAPAAPTIPRNGDGATNAQSTPVETSVAPTVAGRTRDRTTDANDTSRDALELASGPSVSPDAFFAVPSPGSPFTAPGARGVGWWLIAAVLLSAMVGFVVRHVTLRGAMAEAIRSATRDPLTGLPNRRLFDETLAREIARQHRRGEPLALLMIDLDDFKQVNDTRGHMAGDSVLRAVAGAISARVRASDLPARLGGDEFAVILPDCSAQDAQILGEHLRTQIADAAGSPVTASIGVAVVPDDAVERDALVVAADAALYAAKEAGRDQLVVARAGAD